MLAGFLLALWLITGLYLANLGSWFWMRNLLGNLALLLPLGLLGPIALAALDRWWHVALVALLVSTAIELTQLAVPDRFADIDDVIVNVTGALLGFLMLVAVRGLAQVTIGPKRI